MPELYELLILYGGVSLYGGSTSEAVEYVDPAEKPFSKVIKSVSTFELSIELVAHGANCVM